LDLRKKLEDGYLKLHYIGDSNLARKKKEDSKDIYNKIMKLKFEEKKAEEKAILDGLILSPIKLDKKSSIS
jgi:hypothetical protein